MEVKKKALCPRCKKEQVKRATICQQCLQNMPYEEEKRREGGELLFGLMVMVVIYGMVGVTIYFWLC